jgi:hypothetical protein
MALRARLSVRLAARAKLSFMGMEKLFLALSKIFVIIVAV